MSAFRQSHSTGVSARCTTLTRCTALSLRAQRSSTRRASALSRAALHVGLAAAAFLGTASGVCRAQTPAPAQPSAAAAAPKAFSSFFLEAAPKVDLRVRMELADQGPLANFSPAAARANPALLPGRSLEDSTSWTARARLGLLSGEYLGLQAFAELEHTEAWDRDRYNAGPGPHDRTLGPFVPPPPPVTFKKNRAVIADPESTELNQAWLSWASPLGRLKLGRQRIVLDEHRFIGNVGWRQNEQTYDGAVFEAKPLANLDLFYGWIYQVNRIFGSNADDSPENSALRNFDSRSHLVQATYKASELATLRTYAFLLDLSRGPHRATGDAGSSNTFGANLTGTGNLGGVKLAYRAEFARQAEAADALIDYSADYYHFRASGSLHGITLGAGREVLGDDDDARIISSGARTGFGFSTPLATLHAFNGFADVFLVTPSNGLVDDYLFANLQLPAKVALELSFHKYRSSSGGVDYGREINAVLRKPLPWNVTASIKLASYRARDADPNPLAARRVGLRDTLRVIGQLEYRLN